MRRLWLAGCLIVGLSSSSWAGGPGTTSADFLKVGQGVRPIAMGETYVALGDGLDTLSWNPAGLAQLSAPTASFSHSFWVQDIGIEYLSYGTPLGVLGSVAGGLTLLHAGSITQTLEDGSGNYAGTGGEVNATSFALVGGYGQKLSRLISMEDAFLSKVIVGASLLVVNEGIADKNVFGAGINLGAIYRQTEELSPKELAGSSGPGSAAAGKPYVRDRGWRAGFVAQNLGMTSDQMLPINFRLGGGYVAPDLLSPNGRGTVAVDAMLPLDNAVKFSLGAEYAHITQNTEMAVRLGYKIGNEIKDLDATAGITAGLGFAIIASGVKYQVDYAFVPYGELGSTNRIALTVGFLANENQLKNAPVSGVIEPGRVSPISPKTAMPKATSAVMTSPGATPAAGSAAAAGTVAATQAPVAMVAETDKERLQRALATYMNRLKSGILPVIDFEKDSATLLPDARRSLDQLGQILERYPEQVVIISGFAGKDAKLAEARANAVIKYISMSYRVDPTQVKAKAGENGKQPARSAIGFEVQ